MNNKPHSVYLTSGLITPYNWCRQHFDQGNDNNERWGIQGATFYFRDHRDYVWFIMRWSK